MKRESNELSPEGLRLQYLSHAAYYFYKGATGDENLNSTLNRMAAAKDQKLLTRRGLPVPSAEEIYEYAKGKWPEDRLHELPELLA